jgi:hypothetical protein
VILFLTIVAVSATTPAIPLIDSRDASREAHLRGGAGAVPAGGFALRTRAALGTGRPALGPVRAERAAPSQADAGEKTADAGSWETRSGAEPMLVATGVASAAVERRKASAPEAGGSRERIFCGAQPQPAVQAATPAPAARPWLDCASRRSASLVFPGGNPFVPCR